MATSNKTTTNKTNSKTTKQKNMSNVEQMKYEIANEFGVNLGADATSRENGQVGGEITRRLVKMAKNSSNNNE